MQLRGVKALASLPESELAEIEPYLEYREYQPGSEIVHFGSKADDMYLVLSGRVSILSYGTVLENV